MDGSDPAFLTIVTEGLLYRHPAHTGICLRLFVCVRTLFHAFAMMSLPGEDPDEFRSRVQMLVFGKDGDARRSQSARCSQWEGNSRNEPLDTALAAL